MESLLKRKVADLREAWVEEEADREARQRERLDSFTKVTLTQLNFCIVPFFAWIMHCSKLLSLQENGMRQEKLERELSELKENTLAEEEVVRLVEMKCAKLRQEIFCFKKVSLIF